MKTILATLAVMLIFAEQARAAEPPAVKPEPACTCAAAFDRVVEGVETDYAGYQIKVDAKRREAYEGFRSILKADAAGAGVDRCKEVLDTFVDFFQDYHVFVLRGAKAGEPKMVTRSWTERDARAEIDRNRERLDPIEGLWYSKDGRYAVLHETGAAPGTFVAVRLAAGDAPSRDLGAIFQRTGHGSYQVSFRDAQGRWQNGMAALHRGGSLLVFGIEGWGRLDPLDPMNKPARLDPADPEAPLFARLDEKTLYLSLPSFMPDYQPKLDAIIAAQGAEIEKSRGLIIDLRGNGGGNAIYYGLTPYLLPAGPVQVWEDNSILASPRNLRQIEQARAPLGDKGKIFDPAIQRMRQSPGKIVPYLDSTSEEPPPPAPGPRRVVILTDKGVGSAAEGMILLVRKSPRVILVGENTRGNIDYQQAVLSAVGCGDHAYLLGVPLYNRTRRLPEGGLDVIGITPDVPIPDHLADPLAFAVRLLAEGS